MGLEEREIKRCPSCKKFLGRDFFYSETRRPDGLAARCIECTVEKGKEYRLANLEERREKDRDSQRKLREEDPLHIKDRKLWNQYHITYEQYLGMLKKQGYQCANLGCRATNPGGKGKWSWCVDHDHLCCPGRKSCGKCVRGLLCSRCNVALAMVNDSSWKMFGLIYYLTNDPRFLPILSSIVDPVPSFVAGIN